jgi:hypothetical protein
MEDLHMRYVLPLAAVVALVASLAPASADQQSAECAKLAQRFQDLVHSKQVGSIQWSEGEYWAMEGKSYCETGHASEGVAAYQRAIQALGGH